MLTTAAGIKPDFSWIFSDTPKFLKKTNLFFFYVYLAEKLYANYDA
jgi:hypothetical protein